MPSLNRVMLMGNLTRDPEVRYTQSGQAIGRLGMAMNRRYTSSATNQLVEEVTFVDVEVWGKQAETCRDYLHKGNPLFVEGRLKLDQWTDKETGKSRSALRVVAERVQFLSAPRGDSAPQAAAPGNVPPTAATPPQGGNPPPDGGEGEADDIPF